MQFQGPYHKACGIDIAHRLREQFADEFVLTFLQALHAEGHTPKTSDLLLGIAQGQMTEETLVVLVNLVVDKRLLFG